MITARPHRPTGLGLVTLLLALILVAAAAVQGRQFMLTERALGGEDYSSMGLYQVEIEYWRLREEWRRQLQLEPLDPGALQLRYDIWVSRVDLARSPALRGLLGGPAAAAQALAPLDRFIGSADPWFDVAAKAPAQREQLRSLLPMLEALAGPIRTLSIETAHEAARRTAERDEVVRSRSRLGVVLMVLLFLLTVAFVVQTIRQMRQLRDRQRQLEAMAANLEDARRRADAANRAKSVFLADMSHGIRTPLHGMLGMLALLRESGLSARQSEYARTANESAAHLLNILNDILDLSRLDAGALGLNPVPVDPRQLLREVESLMRPQASAKSLALYIDVEPTVPERVLADPTRVKQIVLNLVSNAIQYSVRGTVAIDLRSPPGLPPRLRFVVTDTGIGMEGPTLARAAAGRDAVAGDGPPTEGLGLEISRKLAHLMEGSILVQSASGEGSIVTFEMPLVACTAEKEQAVAPSAVVSSGQRHLNVLVAEDHPVNRRYLAALLEAMHHEAHFVANGHDAVAAVKAANHDLVLMDLHMPGLDGIGATRAIRALADRQAATVPIIALTADAFPETRERCLLAGMNDFLPKPVSPSDLAAALRRLFGQDAAVDMPLARHDPSVPPLVDLDDSGMIDMKAVDAALLGVTRGRLATLIDEFLEQGPATVERLKAAVRDGQPLELRVHAHAACSAALNLGLSGIAQTAQALHEGAAHLPAHEIARLVQRFEELIPRTRRAASDAGLL